MLAMNLGKATGFYKSRIKLLLLFVLVLPSLSLTAQCPAGTKIINYNYKDQTFTNPTILDDLAENSTFYVQIENINRNIFDIQINFDDSVVSKPLEISPFYGIGQASGIAALFPGAEIIAQALRRDNIGNGESPDQNTPMVYGRTEAFNQTQVLPAARLADELKYLKEILTNYYKKLEYQENMLYQKMRAVNREYLNVYSCLTSSQSLHFNSRACDFSIENIMTTLLEAKTYCTSLNSNVDATHQYLASALIDDRIARLSENKFDVAAVAKSASSTAEALKAKILALSTSIDVDKLSQVLLQIRYIKNNIEGNNPIGYCSGPIQFMGEKGELNITILPRDAKMLQHKRTFNYKFPAPKKRYVSPSVSYYFSPLHDKSFYILTQEQTDDNGNVVDTLYNVPEENFSKLEMGVAALVSFGLKHKKEDHFGGHFSIGPGLSIGPKPRPRLLGGIGVSYGNRHNFSLNVGGIVGMVDVRSNSAAETGNRAKPNVLTSPKIDVHGFLSLGYFYIFKE